MKRRLKGFPTQEENPKFNRMNYFAKEGEKGLTSTKANEYANLAKEAVKEANQFLSDMNLSTTTVSCISVEGEKVIKRGITQSQFNTIKDKLNTIAQYNAFIAWCREAIEAKEDLIEEVDSYHVSDYCKKFRLIDPEYPSWNDDIHSEENADIKDMANYYIANAYASVLGQSIHKDGVFASKRDQLLKDINNPIGITGSGRDTVIYTVTPTIPVENVNNLYLELQSIWRDKESQVNKMKYDWQTEDKLEKQRRLAKYGEEQTKANTEKEQLVNDFNIWKEQELKRVTDLKIAIPNAFLDIFNKLRELGK